MAEPRDLSFREGLAMGLLCTVSGAVIVLVSFGVIHAPEESFHAPRWVAGLAGGMFVVIGLYLLFIGVRNRGVPKDERTDPPPELSWTVGMVIVLGMAIISHWIAFGPGERQFEGGITGSETEGRIAFGIGALLIDLLLIGVTVGQVRSLIRRWRGTVIVPGRPPAELD